MRTVFIVLFSFFIHSVVFAENQVERTQQTESGKPLRYLLDQPDRDKSSDEEKFPLVLFLHGGGEGGDDIEKVKRHGLPKLIAEGKSFSFFVVSPQDTSETQFWDDQQLIRLLDEVQNELPVDPSSCPSYAGKKGISDRAAHRTSG